MAAAKEKYTPNYQSLSRELQERIEYDIAMNKRSVFSCKNEDAIRRDGFKDRQNLWRPAFARDADKIVNSAYYNRYADKTQVFSFYKNDDITRRGYHVQLVSRIARSIGHVLGLNTDLIEAIALGHDIGHTPFGHAGEKYLNALYNGRTGRFFSHNVHGVRILDRIFPYNISLQTLSGIIGHNGEMELEEYRPDTAGSFQDFDASVEKAYTVPGYVNKLRASTLEGCLVRICDIIAYLGKDRQDAAKIGLHFSDGAFNQPFGRQNAEIINNMTVNIIENSYGKDYIKLGGEYVKQLSESKNENYEHIYKNPAVEEKYKAIGPMFENIYEKLLSDLKSGNKNSVIFRHHVDFVNGILASINKPARYIEEEPDQIAADFIASMTDDYFIDLHRFLFPESPYGVEYISYFDNLAG